MEANTNQGATASANEGADDAAAQQQAQAAAIRHQLESGANWFYWIAGLSLVNVVLAISGSNTTFVIGLGIAQITTAMAVAVQAESGMGGAVKGLWAASFLLAAAMAACGWFARKPSSAAFIGGMVVFGLDTLIFLSAQSWLGVAFHGLALFYLWQGFSAGRQLKSLTAA